MFALSQGFFCPKLRPSFTHHVPTPLSQARAAARDRRLRRFRGAQPRPRGREAGRAVRPHCGAGAARGPERRGARSVGYLEWTPHVDRPNCATDLRLRKKVLRLRTKSAERAAIRGGLRWRIAVALRVRVFRLIDFIIMDPQLMQSIKKMTDSSN